MSPNEPEPPPSSHHPSTTDGLTGLYDRATFDRRLRETAKSATRDKEALAVVLIEVEEIDAPSKATGAGAGDATLVQIAEALKAVLRAKDQAFRHDAAVFALLLRKCDVEGAKVVTKRLREALDGAPRTETAPALHFSIGVATAETKNRFLTKDLAGRALSALASAKQTGGDRIAFAE